MGMYDTINNEQVKCFSWASLYHGNINYHGGDLACYETDSNVPYKKPHYNYGKNFIILDLNRFPESEYSDYDYILHVIVDGKVKYTFKDKIGNIDWSINNSAVGYSGELLNIKSSEDVIEYINEQRKFWSECDKINTHKNELFGEAMNLSCGIALLDNDSEEKKMRREKIDKIFELIDKEKERIKSDLDDLYEGHKKWFVDTSEINDLINLGNYISATEVESDREICEEKIRELLVSDPSLYDRYVEWQESDEYIKEYTTWKD